MVLSELQIHAIRRELHQTPELSDFETDTPRRVERLLALYGITPHVLVHELGGNGLLLQFNGQEPGPSSLYRCELDALPIQETNEDLPHRSMNDGVAHMCGHDGHMTIIITLASMLAERGPRRGTVYLLFQPAEETGAGALRVVADEKYPHPDYCFALHNVPGYPLGQVSCRKGTITFASRGIIITLTGKTSHAAVPEDGVSPALAMCSIIERLANLPILMRAEDNDVGYCNVTVVHSLLGTKAFGTAPGDAVVMATLRTEHNRDMSALVARAEGIAAAAAHTHGLLHTVDYEDVFSASVNTPNAVEHIQQACRSLSIPYDDLEVGFRFSEDFGVLVDETSPEADHHSTASASTPSTADTDPDEQGDETVTVTHQGSRRGAGQASNGQVGGAMFMLGAGDGPEVPQLHNPDYDFPDQIVMPGARLFYDIVGQIHGYSHEM